MAKAIPLKNPARIALSAGLVGLAILAVMFVSRLRHVLAESQAGLSFPAPVYAGNPTPSHSSFDGSSVWPKFPRNEKQTIQTSRVNGVQVMTEDWQSPAPAADVLSFYREQMLARGWRDVTEQSLGLYSGAANAPKNREALQDDQYLEHYRKSMGSQLVMSRGDWSMHLSTDAALKGLTKVRIFAAATPSINRLAAGLAESFRGRSSNRPAQPFEFVESFGRQRYKTTISVKKMNPARAFEESLADLRSRNWQTVNLLQGKEASGLLAWLVRDNMHAALSAASLPRGQGSSVTFTEVSPE